MARRPVAEQGRRPEARCLRRLRSPRRLCSHSMTQNRARMMMDTAARLRLLVRPRRLEEVRCLRLVVPLAARLEEALLLWEDLDLVLLLLLLCKKN